MDFSNIALPIQKYLNYPYLRIQGDLSLIIDKLYENLLIYLELIPFIMNYD